MPKTPKGVRKFGVSLRFHGPRDVSRHLCLGDFHQLPTRRQPPWGAQAQLLAPCRGWRASSLVGEEVCPELRATDPGMWMISAFVQPFVLAQVQNQ